MAVLGAKTKKCQMLKHRKMPAIPNRKTVPVKCPVKITLEPKLRIKQEIRSINRSILETLDNKAAHLPEQARKKFLNELWNGSLSKIEAILAKQEDIALASNSSSETLRALKRYKQGAQYYLSQAHKLIANLKG